MSDEPIEFNRISQRQYEELIAFLPDASNVSGTKYRGDLVRGAATIHWLANSHSGITPEQVDDMDPHEVAVLADAILKKVLEIETIPKN